jgi:hypothetical protein
VVKTPHPGLKETVYRQTGKKSKNFHHEAADSVERTADRKKGMSNIEY